VTCHKVMRWIIGPAIVLFIALTFLLGVISGNPLLVIIACMAAFGYPLLLILTRLFPPLQNNRLISMGTYMLVMIKASVVGCYKALASQSISWR